MGAELLGWGLGMQHTYPQRCRMLTNNVGQVATNSLPSPVSYVLAFPVTPQPTRAMSLGTRCRNGPLGSNTVRRNVAPHLHLLGWLKGTVPLQRLAVWAAAVPTDQHLAGFSPSCVLLKAFAALHC